MYRNFFMATVLAGVFFSCATAGNARYLAVLADSGEWGLAEIAVNGETAAIDREQLGVFGDAFTLRVVADADGYFWSGKAAPNRFRMPVTVGDDGALTVLPPAATLMAAFGEPDVLKENEYLQYLTNSKRIQVSDDRLVLETADADGQSVSLTFVPFTAEE
jgi:heat shock protein HslJ